MRRNTSKPYVNWNADIRAEILDDFKVYFPMTGAMTWVVGTAVDKFLDLVETSPRLQKTAKDDIQNMLHAGDEDKTGLRSINLKITSAQYARFNKVFPEWGATTWFLRRTLGSVVAYMKDNNLILEELIDVSVSNALRQISSKPVI